MKKEIIMNKKNADWAAKRLKVTGFMYTFMPYGKDGRWMAALMKSSDQNNTGGYISIWIESNKTIQINKEEPGTKGKFSAAWWGKAKTQKEWVKWIRAIARHYGI